MIRFLCPSCGSSASAPDECVGFSTKCRSCRQPLTVPKASSNLELTQSQSKVSESNQTRFLTMTCPACRSKIRAPEALAGKTVKCPGCSASAKIPVSGKPSDQNSMGSVVPSAHSEVPDSVSDAPPLKKLMLVGGLFLFSLIVLTGIAATLALTTNSEQQFAATDSAKTKIQESDSLPPLTEEKEKVGLDPEPEGTVKKAPDASSPAPAIAQKEPVKQVEIPSSPKNKGSDPEKSEAPKEKGPAVEVGSVPKKTDEVELAFAFLKDKSSDRKVTGEQVYRRLLKSAVYICNLDGSHSSTGSGVLVSSKHKIVVTNYHVVLKSGSSPNVILVAFPKYAGGELITHKPTYNNEMLKDSPDLYRARVIYQNEAKDLALVELQSLPQGVQEIPLAKQSAQPGQSVHSIGNPGASQSMWVYTSGTVRTQPYRKKWRSGGVGGTLIHDSTIIETQSPTNSGDSGGPMVNDQGELVAITQGGDSTANAVSIFVDLSEVKTILKQNDIPWSEGSGESSFAQAKYHLGSDDIQKLINLLEHTNPTIRERAVFILANAKAVLAVPALCKCLKDNEVTIRRASAYAIRQMGKEGGSAVNALVEALQDEDRNVRIEASRTICELNPSGPIVAKALGELASVDDPETREHALLGLVGLGIDAEPALPIVQKILENDDGKRQLLALQIVENVGPAAKELLPILTKVLPDMDRPNKIRIFRLLANQGALDQDVNFVVKEAVSALVDSDSDTKILVLSLLESIGPQAAAAVPAIHDYYRNTKDSDHQLQALKTLAAFREAAAPTVTTLVSDLTRITQRPKDNIVHGQISITLAKIGKPSVKQVLKVALYDRYAENRLNAVNILGEIGPPAREIAFEALKYQSMLRERVPEIKRAISAALDKMN